MKQTVTALENGLSVVVVEDHFAPVVSMNIWVNVGSADEKPAQAGLAHVHEHMLFKGTEKRAVGKIASEIEGAGGDINAFTSHDHTCYYVTMASRYFQTGLDVLADAIDNSTFNATELDREIKVILEELSRSRDIPHQKLFENLFAKSFIKHPYGRPIIGYEDVLKNLRRKDVLSFFRRHYRPSNMILVVVGDVDTKKALSFIKRKFARLKSPNYRRSIRTPEPPQKAMRVMAMYDQIHEAIGVSLFHGPGFFHEDSPALDILAMILGNGDSSRLFKRLWEKEGVAYNSWASAYLPADPGIITVGFVTDPERFEQANMACLDEIFRLRIEAPSDEEMEKVKKNLEASLLFDLETYDGRAKKIGYSMSLVGRPELEEEYIERIGKVTHEELVAAAEKYFTPNNMTCGVIAPTQSKKTITTKMLKAAGPAAFEKYKTHKHPARPASQAAPHTLISPVGIHTKSKKLVKITLENGIRLVFATNPTVPVFSIRGAMLGGRRLEPVPGLSNLTSLLLSKGTKNHSASELAEIIEGMGGSLDGFAGQNTLGINGEFLSTDLEKGIALSLEMLTTPSFPEDQMEKLRQELLFELKRREDRLSRKVFDLFFETLYETHPFRIPLVGNAESIEKITQSHIKNFWTRVLNPRSLVFGIAGDINPEKVAAMFEKHLGKLKEKKPLPDPKIDPQLNSPRKTSFIKPKEQAHIVLGFMGLKNTDPQRHAVEVLMTILSGQGGRLFLQLRDRMHLAYAVSGFHAEQIDPGSLGFYLATGNDNVDLAISALDNEVSKLRKNGVTQSEVKRAIRHLVGSFEVELQSNSSVAQQTALSELYGLGYRSHLNYANKIQKVTPEQVTRVARKILDLDKSVLAVIKAK